MGELDDAIREHLDLKRRRGADPAEVERLEREALGPVRRGPEEPQALAGPGDDFQALPESPHHAFSVESLREPQWDGPREHLADDDDPFDDEYDDYEQEFEDDERQSPVAAEDPRVPLPTAVAPASPDPVRFVADPDVPPPPSDDPYEPSTAEFFQNVPSAQEHLRAPDAPLAGGDETVEYDVERAMAAEEKPQVQVRDEDVLEETPEFFSETPDHDRLWFEQRPPRDFDFDG